MRLFLRKSSGSSLKNGTAGRGWVATYSQLWFFVAGVVSCFVFWNIKMSESKKGEGNMSVFFLGAGKPVSGERPSALKEINASSYGKSRLILILIRLHSKMFSI